MSAVADSPLTQGRLISLSQVCRTIPGSRGADRINPSTLTRWILNGVRTADGRRIRLAATRVGYRWMVTAEAVAEFQRALTEAALPDEAAGESFRSPAASRRAAEAAAKELELAGA